MLAMLQPSVAESLSELWAVLHKDAPFTLLDGEVHYLTSLALAADDDMVSYLMLKKLRLAARVSAGALASGVIRMNSYVEFVHGGEKRFCQLLHPSAPTMPGYGLSIDSLTGVGLIGLRAGQSILWPGADGTLCELRIVRVENCPGLSRWLGTSS